MENLYIRGYINFLVNRTLCLGFIFIPFLLIIANIGFTQEMYTILRYTDENGLPQNSVKGIGHDSLGYIWLITEKGPVRYDGGGKFKVFGHLSTMLRSERMYSLTKAIDSDQMWGTTELDEMLLVENGRVHVTDKTYWDIFPKPRAINADEIRFVPRLPAVMQSDRPDKLCLPDKKESGYLITPDSIFYYSNTVRQPSASIPFLNNSPWSFVVHQGALLYLHSANRFECFENGVPIKSGTITGDLAQFDQKTPFRIYWNTAADQLFILVENDLYFVRSDDQHNLHAELLFSGFHFEENEIVVAYYSKPQGQLLLGSSTKGLFVIRKNLFKTLAINQSLRKNAYYLQTLLPDGRILTNHGKTFDSSGNSAVVDQLDHDTPQYNHLIGPSGNLWILEKDSILVYHPTSLTLLYAMPNPTTAKVPLKGDSINYWFGGDQGIICRYDAAKEKFSEVAKLPHQISCLEHGGRDSIYIGTHQGLFVLDIKSNRWEEIPELREKFIRSLYHDAAGRLWITTYQHGFFVYHHKNTTHFPLDNAGNLSSAHCILEDQNGYFWITTNKGLYQVSKMQLLQYRKDNLNHPFYIYYNKSVGFETNEFNGGCQPCGVKLPDGTFSFPSLSGLVWFKPESFIPDFPRSPVLLDEVTMDGTPIPFGDTVFVHPDFSRLSMTFSTPFYGLPTSLAIEYKIEHDRSRASSSWSSLSESNNTLFFNQLSSGDHTIRIRVRTGLEHDDFRETSFLIRVEPRFYESIWATVLLLVVAGVSVWGIVAIRTNMIRKKNVLLQHMVALHTDKLKKSYEWQQRIFASITHDIKAPLGYIVNSLNAIQRSPILPTLLADELQQICVSTRHIHHYSKKLANLAESKLKNHQLPLEPTSISLVVSEQIEIFEPLAQSRGVSISNQVPPDTKVMSHGAIMSVIIHNILDNAIKYTNDGRIECYLEHSANSAITLTFSDTGIGMTKEQVSYFNTNSDQSIDKNNTGLGVFLIKDMAKLISIGVQISSKIGEGTKVSLTFPVN